jgi:histidine ammonia-lyase
MEPINGPKVVLGTQIGIEEVACVARAGARVELCPDALVEVERSRAALVSMLVEGREIYGVTTGFGALVSRKVAAHDRAEAQAALLRSHAAGLGDSLPREVVRGAIAVRLNSLLRRRSAVRPELLHHIAELLNHDLIPTVPRVGSLGASGDLAPSAHAFLPLIGEGVLSCPGGEPLSGAEGLRQIGLDPLDLEPKEGLALINGTHFMAAGGALSAVRMADLIDAADVIASISVVALEGDPRAFDQRIQDLRPLEGQKRSATAVRTMLAGAAGQSGRLQDAYSLRCVPQVHGSAREGFGFLQRMVAVDLNAVTDNPLVFPDPPEVLSGGNFHGQRLALAFDVGCIAAADLASISERRTFRLLSPSTSGGLPDFLSPNPGILSGYMVAQYTAAALVAEIRAFAQPVSIHSIPTSDNQEDHVSFGMTGAWMLEEATNRLAQVLAVELLCGCQALEFRSAALPPALNGIYAAVRDRVPPLEVDRPPAEDLMQIEALINSGVVAAALQTAREDCGSEAEEAHHRDHRAGPVIG